MTTPNGAACPAATGEALQAAFLRLLPIVQTHARIAFRHLRCSARRDDAVAETVALAWRWHLQLAARGKDVLSSLAQLRHGFAVETLACSPSGHHGELYSRPHGQDRLDAFEERLRNNTVTPPPDAAAFRIDFPRWLAGLGRRNRRIAEAMALGENTQELGRRFQLSPGRISQLRREFHLAWQRFHGEVE